MVILTSSAASLHDCAAQVEYVRSTRHDTVDLPAALATLRERFAVTVLLCEGGPHLNVALLAAGLVDELFLTLSPMLAGGDRGDSLRILSGPELRPAVQLSLLGALSSDSEVFLRYGMRPSVPESVSRETTPSSSLDS